MAGHSHDIVSQYGIGRTNNQAMWEDQQRRNQETLSVIP
jgi:hypothetical protein